MATLKARDQEDMMKTIGAPIVTRPTDPEIVLTRVFDAPRSLVFDALTNPDLLNRWLAPPGSSLVVCEVDLKVGGAYRFVVRDPSGAHLRIHGVFREIVRPERLVHTELSDGYSGESLMTGVLVEQGARTTHMVTLQHPSQEVRDAAIKSGMGHHDRLEEVLTAILAGER
jgi:uncharacterized protein YndB with AHSA1/START domain